MRIEDIRASLHGFSMKPPLLEGRVEGYGRLQVPACCTFGFPQYDRDMLAEAARLHVHDGATALNSVGAVGKGGWRETRLDAS